MTAILASGFTQMTNIELTGIGAGQAKNWSYGYLQGRFIYKDLFAQAFWNRSNAGDTYLLRTGQPTIDNSDLYVAQIQHGYSFGTRQRFTYGADLLLTRPDTEGSINGRNEETDNITEIGAYLQSETRILPQLKFIAAVRMDDHHHVNDIADIDDIVLSPRLALAFQPKNDHNFRVTYNRAFNTPGTSNLFLDILSAEDPFGVGIDIRAAGVPSITGFEFGRTTIALYFVHLSYRRVRITIHLMILCLPRLPLVGLRMKGYQRRLSFRWTILCLPTLCGTSGAVLSLAIGNRTV